MVNLHYDYSAATIFFVIMFSMINRKVIMGSINRKFFLLLILSLSATVCDIISEWQVVPNLIRYIFDYFYFILTILIPLTYAIYIYHSIGLGLYLKSKLRLKIALGFPLLIFSITLFINIFTHLAFYITPDGLYTRGPLQPVLTGCSCLYMIIGIIVIFRWRKIMTTEKLIVLLSFFPIMFSALLIQQIYQGLEFTMFGLSISELIISFTVQRRDENFDKSSGAKSFDSAMEDFTKIFLAKQKVRVIYVKIRNHTSLRRYFGTTSYSKFQRILSNELLDAIKKYLPVTEVYYVHDGIYAFKITNTDSVMIKTIADTIYERLSKPFVYNDISVNIDACVCIVRLPEDIDSLDSLMNFRLNFHKKFPETNAVITLSDYVHSKEFKIKNELDSIIANALNDHSFTMYYQPIYSAKEKKFTSAEALIRLQDKKYGFVSPALFIPAAESSGAIHQIGDYVIDAVCDFAERTDFSQLGLKYIELNLSVAQCIESDLVQKIDNCLKNHNLQPDQLNLEITETAEGFDPAIMDNNINLLHKKGYRFSLDDYGTGYSNIKRVTELPLDIVKLDKSFVDEMDNPQMWSVIVNTVKMFKEMNKIILVEGVEDKRTLDKLIELGCDYIQGFYFSKPLPEEEFKEFLISNNKSA